MSYDSRPETVKHSRRVGELIGLYVRSLWERSLNHDVSKMEEPELSVFNEYTPKLKDSTYGSGEYKGFLVGMGAGLQHHYAVNRHHPEHFSNGVMGMTLVDVMEMLADWKAATERMDNGSLAKSLLIQKTRFELSDQLYAILVNTALSYGWIAEEDIVWP